ncbi:MAG TPA: hypothetical protein VGC80_00450, partial [Acetobacteraceae bacterium]
MPDPVTLTALAVGGLSYMARTAIGGHLGNASDRAVCHAGRLFRDRIGGLRDLPENHDLAEALRIAQMQALERVIRSFRAEHQREWQGGQADPHLAFFKTALDFCGPLGSGRKSAAQQVLHLTDPLHHAFEGLLADPPYGTPAGDRTAAIASFAEDAVLNELRTATGSAAWPAGLEQQFRTGDGRDRPRFLDVFGFYFAEQVKEKPRVRDILIVGQGARIEGLAFDTTEMLDRTLKHFDEFGRELRSIGEDVRRTGETVAKTQTDTTQILALVQQLLAKSGGASEPGAERAIGEAVQTAASAAAAGEPQFAQALELLRQNRTAAAEAVFRRIAEEKAARIRQDRQDAAAAYRHLGAIAGLSDSGRELESYEAALQYAEDDLDSLHGAGWAALSRGELGRAERHFRRILMLTTGEGSGSAMFWWYWAKLGTGDIEIQRGHLQVAAVEYNEAGRAAERLAKADPGNAGWQRDLSVSYNKIGDVLVAQGNLPEALRSFRDSLGLRERLAKADPGNAGWQRDLSVSYNKVGDVLV